MKEFLIRPLGLTAIAAALLALAGCGVDRYPLPSVADVSETGFGAGDSVFLMLNREVELGADARPVDLFIDDDGHIYVAEQHAGQIRVFDQGLSELAVPGLETFVLPGVKGVAVGPEQLLYAVAGDDKLWSLNLSAGRETILWGMRSAIGRHRDTGVVDTLSAPELVAAIADRSIWRWEFSHVDSVDVAGAEFQTELEPKVLWEGTGSTRLDGVARGRAGKMEVFVANNNESSGSRIQRIQLVPTAVMFTDNEDVPVVYLYESQATAESVARPGTGLGLVDGATSLDADADGTLYFTQRAATEGYWRAQRMTVEAVAGVDYWSFDFALQGRALMDPDQLMDAVDITYTESTMYVVDRRPTGDTSAVHRVQMFKRNGDYLLPLGARKVPTEDGGRLWVYDQLADPRAVAVYGNRSDRAGNSDETVYVADGTGVKMFMLSVSTDNLPTQ